MVEAPINTAYEGEFLRHQVELVQARWAVVDSDLADRFVAIRDRIPLVEGFWVIDQGDQDEAVARLRAAGWGPSPMRRSPRPSGGSSPSRTPVT